MKSNLEEKQLLINKQDCDEIKFFLPKWLAFSCVALVPLFHMLSYLLSLNVIGQYTYVYFLEEKYPGAPHSLSGSIDTCKPNTSLVEMEVQNDIQKITAKWGILVYLAFIIPGVLLNINLATYSDVYGRKLFFIIPIVGTVLKNICCGVWMYYNMNVRLMLIFYMIEACTGTWVATLSMSFCFIADTTKPGKTRSLMIAVVEGAVGSGALISQFMSGYLIKWTNGFFYPQMIAAGLAFLSLITVFIFIDETLLESRKRKHVSICKNMQRVFDCYRPNFSPHGKRWMFVVLILMFTMSAFANLSRSNVEYLYQIASPFCWDTVTIGQYGAMRNCFWSLGTIILILVFHLFTTDEIIALTGFVTTVASLVIEGLANTDTMLYMSAVASFGCVATMPMVRSIMSRMAPVDKQGSVFAGIAAVESFFSVVGTIAIGIVYDATVDVYRGLTFLIWSIFGLIGLILSLILVIGKKKQEQPVCTKETTITVTAEINNTS